MKDSSEPNLTAGDPLGLRVARARQEAGLSEKELADRLGLPLWRIERLQRGDDDARSLLLEIAEATGKPLQWFLAEQELNGKADDDRPAAERPTQRGTLPENRLVPRSSSPRSRLHTATRRLRSRWGERARGGVFGESRPADDSERSKAASSQKPHGTRGAVVPAKTVAVRVARARQEAGLSQKDLAALLVTPLWRIERIEEGREDPRRFLPAIAARTGRNEKWFTEPLDGAQPGAAGADADGEVAVAPEAGSAATGGGGTPASSPLPRPFRRDVVFAALALLVTSRFFTEVLHILPRAAKLVDVPILILLVAFAIILPPSRTEGEQRFPYMALGVAFLLVGLLSTLSNLGRIAAAPTLLFFYGFLSPVVVYYAVYRLWPPGHALSVSRFLMRLAALEFAVVLLIDVPRFLTSHNPDVVSGTFGQNAYQLVFFLLMAAGVAAGIYTFERRRLAARLAPLFFIATLLTILLAQYRALLFTMATTVLLIATLLGLIRLRGAVASVAIALAFALSLSYVSTQFPALKYSETVSSLANQPGLYISKRASVIGGVGRLYTDNPRFIVTGSGPGTYSSRAWYTFAIASTHEGGLSIKNAGSYQTDVSKKHVLPRLQGTTAQSIGGSYAIASPLQSYSSLLAEVGIFGFIAMVSIYVGALFQSARMTLHSLRRPLPQDPLPGLLLGCTVGFFVLLQMAVLENWLEVTRITFLIWALLAVVSKEFSARFGASAAQSSG
jgi:transcriptional regulator with XRE-family HTH domain